VSGLSNIAAIGSGNWHSYAIQAPDEPSIEGCVPPKGAGDIACNTAISWLPVPYVNHDFQLSKDATFTTLLADINNSTSNTYKPSSELSRATIYYWRVRSRAINLTSPWVTGSFTTVGATTKPSSVITTPNTPTPTAPVTGSTNMMPFIITAVVTAVVVAALMALLFLVFTKGRKKPTG
jgi:hypothetical protein